MPALPSPKRSVTAAEREAYERDGAVVLRDILQDDWLSGMGAAIDRALADPGAAAEEYAKGGKGRYLGDLFMWMRDDDFRAFALASPLPEIARQVMGSQSVGFFYDQELLVKEPMTRTETPWHQDLPYWPLRGQDIASLWIGFDPVPAEAGAMRYVKGSHKAGVMYAPRAFDKSSGFDDIYAKAGLPPFPDTEEMLKTAEILVCPVEPGDIVVHHPLTFHWSPGNLHPTLRRRALALRYLGDDAVYDDRPGTFFADPKIAALLPQAASLRDGEPLGGEVFPRIWP